eukprot:6359862-Karenia_brevis.AAC.1
MMEVILRNMQQTVVRSLGFKPGMRVDYVIEIIRHILRLSATWSQMHAVIVAADILTAFDSIKHALITMAMLKMGVPAGLMAAMMREFVDLCAE